MLRFVTDKHTPIRTLFIVYFFIKVVAMVTKPQSKNLCFQMTFSIFFHIFPTLRICSFLNVYVKFGAKKDSNKNEKMWGHHT